MKIDSITRCTKKFDRLQFHLIFQHDKVAVYLPPRKPEPVVEEKPTSLFGAKGVKPIVPPAPVAPPTVSTNRPAADEPDDIYKTHPAFVAIIEPIANKFMTLKELIEVKKTDRYQSAINFELQKLRSIGLNVFPETDSDSYVSVINKVRIQRILFVSKNDEFYFRIINQNGGFTIKWQSSHRVRHFLTAIGMPLSMMK